MDKSVSYPFPKKCRNILVFLRKVTHDKFFGVLRGVPLRFIQIIKNQFVFLDIDEIVLIARFIISYFPRFIFFEGFNYGLFWKWELPDFKYGRWEKLYLSKLIDVSLTPKHLSSVLSSIGEDIHMWYDLFSKLATKGDLLLYDLTSVFTHSKNIKLAERGYNADHEYIDQIGVIMAFLSITKLPVGKDVFYGSMKDITTVRDFIARFPKKDIGFIFDRGFSSYGLLDDLRGDGIHYIVPLRKDSTLIDLRWMRRCGTGI